MCPRTRSGSGWPITVKGLGSTCVFPSTVTCFSSMASSRADWVLGVARFISSASTIWEIMGPGLNSNSEVFWLKIETPVTSLGSRSGVNWMRRKLLPEDRARLRASMVLPTPGTSSMSTWPWQIRAMTPSSMAWSLPTITCFTFCTIRPAISRALSMSAMGSPRASCRSRWLPEYVLLRGQSPGRRPRTYYCLTSPRILGANAPPWTGLPDIPCAGMGRRKAIALPGCVGRRPVPAVGASS